MKAPALFSIFALSVLFLFGCVTTTRMNEIGIGMTKEEVISVMGNPASTASPGGGVEVLRFYLEYEFIVQEYFIRLENGKVASYGRMGDFDSTKDPTQNINLNVKQE